MRKCLILAFALTSFPLCARAVQAIPDDCWFGAMNPDKATHGQLVASGPVTQWRVGTSLTFYPTKEDDEQLNALIDKGQTGTFDTSRPITVVPTWISGPEPGDKDSGEDKDIEVTIKYRDAQGETGIISLSYWTPMSGKETASSDDQRESIARIDQQLHDAVCRGIP